MTEEQRKLAADNHNLIYSFLNLHQYDWDEYYDLAAIGLCKSAITYDKNKGPFSTYAYKCMFNEIGHYFTIQGAARRIPDQLIMYYDAKTNSDNGDESCEIINCLDCGDRFEDRVITNTLIDICRAKLSVRDNLIFDMLADGYTTREIGKVAGCSGPSVTNIRRRICNLFEKMEVV